jgi:hypothetical protein
MLKLEVVVHDQMWPTICITTSRESTRGGPAIQQHKVMYDLAYGKAEEMVHNALKPMVEELIGRHKRS